METTTIRLNNLRRLVAGYESQQAFAEVAGLSVQYLNQLLGGHRNIGEKTARKIEAALRLELGWLDRGAQRREDRIGANDQGAGLSRRALMMAQMFDQLAPEQQDAMQTLLDALAQSKVSELRLKSG